MVSKLDEDNLKVADYADVDAFFSIDTPWFSSKKEHRVLSCFAVNVRQRIVTHCS